jgi:hypothetical protein
MMSFSRDPRQRLSVTGVGGHHPGAIGINRSRNGDRSGVWIEKAWPCGHRETFVEPFPAIIPPDKGS